jgi:energy-converting hydrogenase Eha subunit C
MASIIVLGGLGVVVGATPFNKVMKNGVPQMPKLAHCKKR